MQFRLIVEYDGTDYCGWQVQPNGRSIQGTLEAALGRLLGHAARVVAAGRTDAGVHAVGQVACFRTHRTLDPWIVHRALNALTPDDVAIRSVEVVAEGFDPRRGARSRAYVYRIWNDPTPSPFWRRYAWHIPQPLAFDGMAAAATVLVGEHDFSSFRAAGCQAAHAVRRVCRSEMHRDGALLQYRIEATAFVRHMVRNIAGTLVDVGRGRRNPDDVRALLQARDRTRAGVTAPAHGLCLTEVKYE